MVTILTIMITIFSDNGDNGCTNIYYSYHNDSTNYVTLHDNYSYYNDDFS